METRCVHQVSSQEAFQATLLGASCLLRLDRGLVMKSCFFNLELSVRCSFSFFFWIENKHQHILQINYMTDSLFLYFSKCGFPTESRRYLSAKFTFWCKRNNAEQQLVFILVLSTVGPALHPFTALEFSADSNVEVCPGNAARAPWTAYVSSRLRLCHFDIRAVKYVRYELFISLWPLIHLSLLHQVIVLQAYRVSVVLLLLTRGNWKKKDTRGNQTFTRKTKRVNIGKWWRI